MHQSFGCCNLQLFEYSERNVTMSDETFFNCFYCYVVMQIYVMQQ